MGTLMPTALDTLGAQLFHANPKSPRNAPSLSANIDTLIDALLVCEQQLVGPRAVNMIGAGAPVDGTTDCIPALTAAYNSLPSTGGTIEFPFLANGYQFNSGFNFTKPVWLRGAPSGNATGTVLKFAAGVGGFAFPQNLSQYSRMENFWLLSADGGAAADDGLAVGSHGFLGINVMCQSFGRYGFNLDSSAVGANADNCTFINCRAANCFNDGWFIAGGISNVINFMDCSATACGGWGFNEAGSLSNLGNIYTGCHTATNALGPYINVSGHSDASVYSGCYSEGGAPNMPSKLYAPALVLGGTHGAGFSTDSTAAILVPDSSGGFGIRSGLNLHPLRGNLVGGDWRMPAGATSDMLLLRDSANAVKMRITLDAVLRWESTLATGTATAGAAALPANPVGFLDINVAGSPMKIPYYNP